MSAPTLTITAFSDGRWAIPCLGLVLLAVFVLCDLFQKTLPAVRAHVKTADGKLHALYGETLIGSGKNCDHVLPGLEKRHGVLYLREDGSAGGENISGSWSLTEDSVFLHLNLGDAEYSGILCRMQDNAGTEVTVFSAVGGNESVWGVKYDE